MYNSGNSSKNVRGSNIIDGTVETVDIADDAVTVDKLANAINTDIATGVSGSTTAGDALPKAGGAMTGAITTNSTFDGVDIATRDGILTTTTATANDALPKAGGAMTGLITNFASTSINDDGTAEIFTITSNNRVGIGTGASVDRLFHVQGGDGLADGEVFTRFEGTSAVRSLQIADYACGADHSRPGFYFQHAGVLNSRYWADDTGDLRFSSGNPTADTSGTVVGTQTFTGTHIYKSGDDTLKKGEAVKLVARKLARCTTAQDSTCIGIFIGRSEKNTDSFGNACTYEYEGDLINPDAGYAYAIASLGDTITSICDNKLEGVLVDGAVSAGDLLCTSSNGLLTKQTDDVIHSYTVAKAGEDGDASAPVYSYIYCG